MKNAKGTLMLAGGAEFGGEMEAADRRAITLAGGSGAAVAIIPAAAAPDHNHLRAGGNGERWFRGLGSTNVVISRLIDRESAEQPEIAAELGQARLIYLLGGFTHYLAQTLVGSRAAAALEAAYAEGAVIAGSSAGAMVLCEHYYNPGDGKIYRGLNFVHQACVLPHHNTFGRRWAARVGALLPESTLLGIDERTAMVGAGFDEAWQVLGAGGVTLYRDDRPSTYASGQRFAL